MCAPEHVYGFRLRGRTWMEMLTDANSAGALLRLVQATGVVTPMSRRAARQIAADMGVFDREILARHQAGHSRPMRRHPRL